MNLPEPFGYLTPTARSPAFHFLERTNEGGMPVYTADQMRAYAAEAAARAFYKLLEDADILATYSRTDGRREWVNVGVWLRPGEVIVHMDECASSGAPAPVGLPAGEQTGPVAGAPAQEGGGAT